MSQNIRQHALSLPRGATFFQIPQYAVRARADMTLAPCSYHRGLLTVIWGLWHAFLKRIRQIVIMQVSNISVPPIFDEALYRRCAGEGEGEGEGEEEGGSESDSNEDNSGDTGGDDSADEDAENVQLASNSPQLDCILTQMGLFPMPNFGLCESLSDTPPTPDPAPPVTPVPAPATPEPQPVPAPAPAPAHKPVPVDADPPARAIPKRAIENLVLGGVLP